MEERFAGRSGAPALMRGYRPRVQLHPGRGGVPAYVGTTLTLWLFLAQVPIVLA